MLISYVLGQGSVILRVKILNSSVATGAGLTGLAFGSAGLVISTIADNEATATAYTQALGTVETIATLGTYAAPTATKCRFREVDATNHPGVYELHVADARFAVAGAKSMIVSISGATNCAQTDTTVPLVRQDPYATYAQADLQAVKGTALPSEGAPGQMAAAAGFFLDVPVPVLTAAFGAQAVRDAMKLAPGAGAASAGSVDTHLDDILQDTGTDGVVVATGSKTGYALSAAGNLAIWHVQTALITAVGSIGKWILDYLDMAISAIQRQVTVTFVDTSGIPVGCTMRSIADIADRAYAVYPPLDGGTHESIMGYQVMVEEGYRELVQECGGMFRRAMEMPFVIGQREYALPGDFRETLKPGLSIYYTPRTISSISRAANVTTVVTATAHNLAVGMTARIADVDPVGSTVFDGDFVVATAPTATQFTYADTADPDSGTGGTVQQAATVTYPPYEHVEDMDLKPHDSGGTDGVPTSYSYMDAHTLVFDPIPDGAVPAFTLIYDAGPSPTLTTEEALVGYPWLEGGLIRYAALHTRAIPEKDREMRALALKGWEDCKRKWRIAMSQMTEQNSR